MERSPVPSVCNLHRWKIDCVEIHVVFAHELIKIDVLGIKPPSLPLRCEIRGYANVAYRGFKLKAIRQSIIVRWK